MKVCFSARSSYGIVSPKIFRELKKSISNLEACFVADNENTKKKLLKDDEGLRIECIDLFVRDNWNKIHEEDLKLIEDKFDCAPIWQYIYTDRFLIKRNYDYALKMTVALFMFFDKLFSNYEYEYYYDETIATLQSYAAYLVGKKYGVRYIGQMTFRKAETTKHYVFSDPFQYICGFNNDYMEKTYSKEIRNEAEKYLLDFESSTGKSDIMNYVKSKPKFELKWLAYAAFLASKKECHNPYDYMNYHYYSYFVDRFMFYGRYLREKKHYQYPDLSCDYVYFPLHYQPEASTIVCAQKYEKQLFFIDSIAKSLPANTKLFVKEHYALLGHRDVEFYKQLELYPNVIIVNPFMSSMELIKNARTVVTLTGTAGWEAMLLRKPVILGGKIYFDNAPGVIYMDDVYLDFYDAMEKWVQPSRDQVVQYLCECFTNVYDGSAYFAVKEYQTDENIEKVSASLLKFMSK